MHEVKIIKSLEEFEKEFGKVGSALLKTGPGARISRFLTQNARGPFVLGKIERELAPLGGDTPLTFAVENKAPGMVGSTYRNYLAARLRQGRVEGEALRGAKPNLPRWEALEDGAQRMLERISRF
jgi:hypothetical protein